MIQLSALHKWAGPSLESPVDRNALIVVMETGAPWPNWLESFRREAPNVIVVVQQPGEGLSALLMRTRRRIATLAHQPLVVTRAILLAGRDETARARRVRVTIASTLAALLEGVPDGRLVIANREPLCRRSAQALFGLAQRMAERVRHSGIAVSTRLVPRPAPAPALAG